MAVEWANSANKHGIDHEDALHAIENALYVEQERQSLIGPALGARIHGIPTRCITRPHRHPKG